jgi:enoyl-CoA hydratase/carnithine racemase
VLSAKEARDFGLVAELHPREKLLPRAWELAAQLARRPEMLLRYTRAVLTHPLRKALEEGMQYFLAMEKLSTLNKRDA